MAVTISGGKISFNGGSNETVSPKNWFDVRPFLSSTFNLFPNTEYKNTTGYPLHIQGNVSPVSADSISKYCRCYVNGIEVANSNCVTWTGSVWYTPNFFTFIVPNNATFQITNSNGGVTVQTVVTY